jgi:hypothetical protein
MVSMIRVMRVPSRTIGVGVLLGFTTPLGEDVFKRKKNNKTLTTNEEKNLTEKKTRDRRKEKCTGGLEIVGEKF